MGALWSGQKQADISGSVTEPSDEGTRENQARKRPAWSNKPQRGPKELLGSSSRHTFINHGHFWRDADDAHEVDGRNQGAQDGPNSERFTFTCIDELEKGIFR